MTVNLPITAYSHNNSHSRGEWTSSLSSYQHVLSIPGGPLKLCGFPGQCTVGSLHTRCRQSGFCQEMFSKMDGDQSNSITKEEAELVGQGCHGENKPVSTNWWGWDQKEDDPMFCHNYLSISEPQSYHQSRWIKSKMQPRERRTYSDIAAITWRRGDHPDYPDDWQNRGTTHHEECISRIGWYLSGCAHNGCSCTLLGVGYDTCSWYWDLRVAGPMRKQMLIAFYRSRGQTAFFSLPHS